MSRQPPTSPRDGADAPADPREPSAKALRRVSVKSRTPFDDLDGFAVLTAVEVAARMRIDPRSVRRAAARGDVVASRSCGLRILAADAAAWWRSRSGQRPQQAASVPAPSPAALRTAPRRRLVRSTNRLPLPPGSGRAA